MENNTLFQKNLNSIKAYDIDLYQELISLPSNDGTLSLNYTNKNEPNLLYKNYPLHSMEGAIDETKKVFWDKDPFLYEECRNCNVLPLCYGGCQMKRKIKNEEACSPELKYNINKLVLHLYYNNYYGD